MTTDDQIRSTDHFWYRLQPPGPYVDTQRDNKAFGYEDAAVFLSEDCAQEVLLRVYRHRERYEAKARFVTYLFHVARNHWIDIYRHRKAGPTTLSADVALGDDGSSLAGELQAPPESPGAAADRAELRAALERAIAALGDEHRQVFVLAQVEGLRYQEIGEILGVPVGTVKSRMHAAHRQIREALAREGFEP